MISGLNRQKSFMQNYFPNPHEEAQTSQQKPFSWTPFLAERALVPATSANMFPHVKFLEKKLVERLYPPGMEVNLKIEDGARKRVKIEVVCEHMALVEFVESGKIEWVEVGNFERPEFTCDGLEWLWYCNFLTKTSFREQGDVIKLFEQDKPKMFHRIGDFIQV